MKHRQPIVEYKNQPKVPAQPKQAPKQQPVPPPKPAEQSAKLPSQPKVKPDPFIAFVGERLTMQSRGGLVYQGTYAGLLKGFFKLDQATVTGLNQAVTVAWLFVDRNAIAHLYPMEANR